MSATSSTRLSPSPNLLQPNQPNQPKRYGSTLSLEEKCEQSFFLFYYYRMEDEAVLDRGASLLKKVCDEEEVEGKWSGVFPACGGQGRREDGSALQSSLPGCTACCSPI